ncbi:high affinity sulfate permease [Coprinopsis cinerea okayama7|uniref:High affinity sulfate permease n=1 Tax=Coprinopsis cinerea (strain Okayama-7 / 130 / ATCC MYA-4618 / FGSC 9003) TaxID=240176 RepID=A8NH03_COPC7|nr:high affinity sulfate permease [Coprinopsis cinerea okayama7\|eukprot:XP_001833644.2 high affinity sulfate permease [Coprinopsis cinerea okayama7\
MASAFKRWSKRVVKHPEETVPIISSTAWAQGLFDHPTNKFGAYVLSLFPIVQWLPRYNFGWLSGDLIAGITVGMVVIPQGMSYAQLAGLTAEYGLYSSFVGVLFYCFFATSKDVSIGPVAVMSILVSQIINHVESQHPGVWTGPDIAAVLAVITGFITLGMGLLRIGWLVEFIPAPAVSGFMTGSAFTIATTQIPGLMGITGFSTRDPAYQVIINTLKNLGGTKLDAAWGITGLVSLYAIRYFCIWGTKRYPARARWFFFMSVMRNAFVIIVLTLASFLYNRKRLDPETGKYPIRILLTVPSGFKHVRPPPISTSLLSALGPKIPVATIILLLEHIAIAKSFGRLNGYKINPAQELIAIGVTNTVGSVFGAYPATGSFSRSALKSKCGVRTPAAGVVTAVVVIVALYGLTDAFFWIPMAGLSAVIIHAVADLMASPDQVYSYWRISPLEFLIWAAAVLITVFSSIENGIYTSVVASLVLLLVRLAHPRDSFLGKVTIHQGENGKGESRDVYLPLTKNGITNPHVKVTPPAEGVIIYRFEESYLYPNSSIPNSALVDEVKTKYRRGQDMTNVKPSDRPWNDYGKRRSGAEDQALNLQKPVLHAIVLDFSSVSHIDTTSVQALIDARREIEKWADHPVEFHFAPILSPWIHRALVAGGFGIGNSHSSIPFDLAAVVPYRDGTSFDEVTKGPPSDIESGGDTKEPASPKESESVLEPVVPTNTPFFHIDLASAVKAAESGVERVHDKN